jgi:hypothetical protein
MANDMDEADDLSITAEENGTPLPEGGKSASLPIPMAVDNNNSYQALKKLDRIPARVKYNVAHYFFLNDVGNSSHKKERVGMKMEVDGEDLGDTTSVSSASLSYRPPTDVDINDRKAVIKHFLSYLSKVYEVRGVLNYKDDQEAEDDQIGSPDGRKEIKTRKVFFDMEIVGELFKIMTCKAKIREIYELLKEEEINQEKEEFNKILTYQSSMIGIYDWRMIIDFNDYNNMNNRPFLSFYKEQLKSGGYLHTLLKASSPSSSSSSLTGSGSGVSSSSSSHLVEEKYLPKLSFCSSLVKSNYEKSLLLSEIGGLPSENKNEVIIHYELPKSIETSLFRNLKIIMEEKLGFSKEISFNALVLLSRYLLSSLSDTTSIVKESVIILSAIILLTFKSYHALTPLSSSSASSSSSTAAAAASSLIPLPPPSLSSVFSSSSSIKPSFLKKIIKFVYCQLHYRNPMKEDNSSILHLLPKVIEKENDIYSKALCYDCYIPSVFSFLSSSFFLYHQQIISEESEYSLSFLLSEGLSLSQFCYSSYFGLVNAFSLELLMMSCLVLNYYYLKEETKEERREERRSEEKRRKEEEERNRRRQVGGGVKKEASSHTPTSSSFASLPLPIMNDDILPLTLLQQVMNYFEISSSSVITAMKYLVGLLELTRKSTSFSSSSSTTVNNNTATSVAVNSLPVLLDDYYMKRSKDSSSSSSCSLHSLLDIALKELLTIRNDTTSHNNNNDNKGDLVTPSKGWSRSCRLLDVDDSFFFFHFFRSFYVFACFLIDESSFLKVRLHPKLLASSCSTFDLINPIELSTQYCRKIDKVSC